MCMETETSADRKQKHKSGGPQKILPPKSVQNSNLLGPSSDSQIGETHDYIDACPSCWLMNLVPAHVFILCCRISQDGSHFIYPGSPDNAHNINSNTDEHTGLPATFSFPSILTPLHEHYESRQERGREIIVRRRKLHERSDFSQGCFAVLTL